MKNRDRGLENTFTTKFVYALNWLKRRLQTTRRKSNERTSELLRYWTKKYVKEQIYFELLYVTHI